MLSRSQLSGVMYNRKVGRDLHAFECLLHVNELYLTHYIKDCEGDTKALNKMQAGSV